MTQAETSFCKRDEMMKCQVEIDTIRKCVTGIDILQLDPKQHNGKNLMLVDYAPSNNGIHCTTAAVRAFTSADLTKFDFCYN